MAKIIAYGTDKQGYFDLFMASCRRHGISPCILGWGSDWVGYGKKTTDIRDYLVGLPEDEVVVSVDPFDVVFLCGADEIESKFRQGGWRFLCGALRLGPLLRLVYEREFNWSGTPAPKTPTGYDYLNSGTWISTAGYARRLIERLESEFDMSPTDMDQEILTSLYVNSSRDHSVDIDWRCEIFHNLLFRNFITRTADEKDLAMMDGRLCNTATGSTPCILHASGNARMEGLAARLGYRGPCTVPTGDNKSYLKKAFFHILQIFFTRHPVRQIAAVPDKSP